MGFLWIQREIGEADTKVLHTVERERDQDRELKWGLKLEQEREQGLKLEL